MHTSHFYRFYKTPDPRLVAIAIKCPEWYQGRRYEALNPPLDMLHHNLSDEEWAARYHERVLAHLDPRQVYHDLGEDAIMLCWEQPGAFCHRRLVAAWLERHLGIVVPELPANYHPEQKTLFWR